MRKGRLDEAIASYEKAIELDAQLVPAHHNLGNALSRKNRVDEAIVSYRKAIELDPKHAGAHNGLGCVLCDVKKDYDGAIACFRLAIDIDPNFARVHFNLGNALRSKGWLDEAIATNRKAIELDPNYADAHYNDACYALLVATSLGRKFEDEDGARYRQQALNSLRTALALYAKQPVSDKSGDRAKLQKILQIWQRDTDLAEIREPAALAKLPADERKAFTQLWADVAALLKLAEEKAR